MRSTTSLERALLLGRVRRPERRVAAARVADAEQVFAPAVEREPVALEIEEEIAARRLRQAQEAVLGSSGSTSCWRSLRCGAPCSWIAAWSRARSSASREPRVGFGTSSRSPSRSSVSTSRRVRSSLICSRLMPATKHEMIVGAPARVALAPPAADVAMLRRLGIRDGVARGERGFEPVLHEPVVGGVVGEPIALRDEAMVRRHDVRCLAACSLAAARAGSNTRRAAGSCRRASPSRASRPMTSYDQAPSALGRATLRRKSARPCQRSSASGA